MKKDSLKEQQLDDDTNEAIRIVNVASTNMMNACHEERKAFHRKLNEAARNNDFNNPIFNQDPPDCRQEIRPGFQSIREPGNGVDQGISNLEVFIVRYRTRVKQWAPELLAKLIEIEARLGQ